MESRDDESRYKSNDVRKLTVLYRCYPLAGNYKK